jgi:hypothetical protein
MLLGVCVACTSGPGRTPIFPDAQVFYPDAVDEMGFPDAPYDAGVNDSAVVLNDFGFASMYSFTGIFGITGDSQEAIYAREVGGNISIVVGAFPYVYAGTISTGATGNAMVNATSDVLARAGCTASVVGIFDRTSPLYELQHTTCDSQGRTISSMIRGGIATSFDPSWSGIYAVTATVVENASLCFTGGALPPMTWALDFLPSSDQVEVYMPIDAVPNQQAFYIGTYEAAGAFSATAQWSAVAGAGPDVSLQGTVTQVSATDPVQISGTRSVIDYGHGNCVYSIQFSGVRSSGP